MWARLHHRELSSSAARCEARSSALALAFPSGIRRNLRVCSTDNGDVRDVNVKRGLNQVQREAALLLDCASRKTGRAVQFRYRVAVRGAQRVSAFSNTLRDESSWPMQILLADAIHSLSG